MARRPTLAAALLYGLLAIVMVGQGLAPDRTLSPSDWLWTASPWSSETPDGVRLFGANGELADAAANFHPFTLEVRDRLPSAPLWNPEIMGGRPLLANMQSGVLSPFQWPSFALPFFWSLGLIAALKLLVSALGTFVLARALGQRWAGAFLAGLAYGFSLWIVTWLAWPTTSVWAILPWILVAIDRVVRRPDAVGVALLALASALTILGGHPESSFHVAAVAVLFAALRIVRQADERRRRALLTFAGLSAGIGLSAVILLPFLELLLNSGDLDERAGKEPAHIRRSFGLGLLMPEYWGRPSQVTVEGFINARAFYAGALPLLLAGVALLRPTLERVAIAVTTAVSLLVVLGIPPFFEALHLLPGFAQALNGRLGVVVVLGVALLAGFGLGDLLDRHPLPRISPAALAAAVLVPGLGILAFRGGEIGDALGLAAGLKDAVGLGDPAKLFPTASAFLWLAFAGAGAALILATARGRLSPRVAAPAAIALVAVDLFRMGLGQNPAIPLDHAKQPDTPLIGELRARHPARFAGLVPDLGIQPVTPDTAMRLDLHDARGYDYPVEKRYDKLWTRSVAPKIPFIPPTTLAASTPEARRVLALLGVRTLVQQQGDKIPPGLTPSYDERDGRIYDIPEAVPRTWVVGRAERVAGEDAALDAITAPGFAPLRTLITEDELGPLGGAGSARITSYEPERVELATRTTGGESVVVLDDVWFPGWKAEVDGEDAELHRVDYLLRGVRVPAGAHTVTFSYQPLSFRIGWIISLTTLLGLVVAVVLGRRRRA